MNQIIKVKILLLLVSFIGSCGFIANIGNKQTPTPSATQSETPRPVDARDLFRTKEAEFTNLPAKTQLTAAPYIKGKAVLYAQDISLDAKAKNAKPLWVLDANPINRKFPVAQKPEEVGTVILQKCEEVPMGSYAKQFTEEKIPSYGWKCEVTIVDKTIPAVIHRKTFQTDMQGAENPRNGEIRRSSPTVAINDFLGGLPQK